VRQLVGPSSRHWPAGSGLPAETGEQVPARPVWLQEKQLAVQAVPQQTPWAQKLEAHSAPAEQRAPVGFLPQDPFTQTAGDTHWLSLAQLAPQPAPLQRKGAQEVAAGDTQRPPLQVPSCVSRLLAGSQLPARQGVPVG
jgi:hypothetical protein